MENPSNWGKVRRAIDRAIEKNKLEGEDGRLGRSVVSTIYDELHASGYVAEGDPGRTTNLTRPASNIVCC